MLKAFIFLAAIILAVPAAASIHGGPAAPLPPSGCTYPTALVDGCVGAQAAGTFEVADLYTYAAQSGQTWISHHPQDWNVAGVNYWVGRDPGLTYKDPSIDKASLPSGCTYSATSSFNNTGPAVTCAKSVKPVFNGWDFSGEIGGEGCVVVRMSSVTTGPVTFTNNRFKPSKACLSTNNNLLNAALGVKFDLVFNYNEIDGNFGVFINKDTVSATLVPTSQNIGTLTVNSISANSSSTLPTLYKNDFLSGAPLTGDVQVTAAAVGNGPGVYTIKCLAFGCTLPSISTPTDFQSSASPAGATAFDETGNAVIEYNHLHDIFNLPMTGNFGGGSVLTAFNVVDGFNQACFTAACLHGAYFEILMTKGSTTGSVQHSYNNIILRSTNVAGITATFTFLSQHVPTPWVGVSYDSVKMDHNTVVTNLKGGIGGTNAISGALSWMAYLRNIVTYTQQDNWVDPIAALDCVENFGGAGSSGSNQVQGWVDNGAGAVGNTLTITLLTNGGLWPGAYVHVPGMSTDQLIQPYGSTCDGVVSTGNDLNPPNALTKPPVTYCIGGPPVKVGSSVAQVTKIQTKTTPVTNLVFGGTGHENKSLYDASTITMSGNSWNLGACHPIQ